MECIEMASLFVHLTNASFAYSLRLLFGVYDELSSDILSCACASL